MTTPPVMVRVEAEWLGSPPEFFDVAGRNEATVEECREEVRRAIADHGVGAWLREWQLEDLVQVFVGGVRL